MSYDPSLLSTSALMRVRLTIGDTDPDDPFLQDAEINYFISSSASEKQAAIAAAKAILANFTKLTRERAGQVEIYGQERYENYRQWLKDFVSDPHLSSVIATPKAGGIDIDDFRDTENNSDNIGVNVGWKKEDPNEDSAVLDTINRFE